MTVPSSIDVTTLQAAGSYRELAQLWMDMRATASIRLSYAAIARRGGFATRSFPRDVILGSKRLSPRSLAPFIHGLGLKGDWAELFRLLVEEEHADCRAPGVSLDVVQRKLKNVRSRLKQQDKQPNDFATAFEVASTPIVYAALGSLQEGASLGEVTRRTGFTREVVAAQLSRLLELGLVRKVGSSYIATASHLTLPGLTQNDLFKRFFLASLGRAADAASTDFASLNQLYFTSCFSVNRRDLPKLKAELRDLLHRFVDNSEVAKADTVVTLVTGLF